jgi:hypothetical protein
MKLLNKIVVGAVSAGILGFMAASASAAIVCSGHECWHTHEVYEFPREAGVVVHPDNWRWSEHEHFTWREHEGRGFWRDGGWRAF